MRSAERAAQPFEQKAADKPPQAAADQAVDQAFSRPIRQPLAQADPQPEHGPRESAAEQAAAQEADDDLARHQPDRAAQRGRRCSPGDGSGHLEPGTVTSRAVRVQEHPERTTNQEAGPARRVHRPTLPEPSRHKGTARRAPPRPPMIARSYAWRKFARPLVALGAAAAGGGGGVCAGRRRDRAG